MSETRDVCDGCESEAGVIDGLCPRCHRDSRAMCGQVQPHRRPPELGAIHADGGLPEHMPAIYDDGRS